MGSMSKALTSEMLQGQVVKVAVNPDIIPGLLSMRHEYP